MSKHPALFSRDTWFGTPLLVFAISLTITLVATWYLHVSTQRRDHDRFNLAVDHAMGTIEKRLTAYQAMLRSAAGMLTVEERPSKEEFSRYFATTHIRAIYPGLQGLGYARYVPSVEIEQFEAERRAAGFPDFRVRPTPTGEYFSAIVLIEPFDDRNGAAIGFDMSSEETRARAMWRSVEANQPRGTGRVTLVQEVDSDRQNGFLIYQPVFKPNMPIDTPEQRRAALDGWVYSPFRVGDLMRGIFARIDSLGVHMSIYDSPEADESRLLHSNILDSELDTRLDPIDRTIDVAGRTWTVRLVPQAAFSDVSSRKLMPLVLLGGIGVSLLLTGVTASLSRSRDRANQIAEELRESQSQLRQSELRFRRLVESNLIGVAFIDVTGRVLDANDEALRMIGRTRRQVVEPSFSWRHLTPPEFRESDARATEQLQHIGVAQPFETEFLRPDGRRTPALVGMAMLEGSDSQCIWLLIDLSDRKRFESELSKLKDDAVAANRAKDQFLAVLSHELRTPLTPVLALAAAGAENADLPEASRKDFEIIRRNVELEARLIDDLLDLTKIGRGKLKVAQDVIDLHEVVAAAVDVTSREAIERKRLDIRVDLSALRYHVLGDAARLQQVFWNLVQNAVKFTPADGVIVIRSQNIAASDPTIETGELIEVEVIDSGVGIERTKLSRIFDAFEQVGTGPQLGGLGLGLAISRGLIHAHGGTIRAFSEGMGRGSRFVVRLATTPAPAILPDPKPSVAPTTSTDGTHVLLVEDHADSAGILARLLTRIGYRVTIARSVEQATAVLQRETFGIVISDIGLPDGSGNDILRALRRSEGPNREVCAIALTGYGMDDDVAATRDAGFDEHITKPVNFAYLREVAQRLLAAERADA